ncbi:MAG TPA: hypothetical protein V6C82_04440 [Chroococcales cyanobacterium]|jgi:hypothetical protein
MRDISSATNRLLPGKATAPLSVEKARDEEPSILAAPDRANADRVLLGFRDFDEAAIQKKIKANLSQEVALLMKFSPEQQGRYEKIVHALPATDPEARLSLQRLLLDGKLLEAKDKKGEGTLLDNLSKLADQRLEENINRGELLSDVVQEVENPVCIAQEGKGTCGASTVQIMLASENPAEYARLISGLASPEGKTTLANGEEIARKPGTEMEDGALRTVSTRLLVPAFMEYGNGMATYDNEKDKSSLMGVSYPGLTYGDFARLAEGVLNRSFEVKKSGLFNDAGDLLKQVARLASPSSHVPLVIDYPGLGFHAVQVTEVKEGRVNYINPWGRLESLGEEAFTAKLKGVLLPDSP